MGAKWHISMRRIGNGGLPYEIKRDHQGLRIQAHPPTAPSGELFERHRHEHEHQGIRGWGCRGVGVRERGAGAAGGAVEGVGWGEWALVQIFLRIECRHNLD
jgi:hypothetical protein